MAIIGCIFSSNNKTPFSNFKIIPKTYNWGARSVIWGREIKLVAETEKELSARKILGYKYLCQSGKREYSGSLIIASTIPILSSA